MTMNKLRYESMVKVLIRDALEMFEDGGMDRGIAYDAFLRVMWSDDKDRREWGATRDDYRAALRKAFVEIMEGKPTAKTIELHVTAREARKLLELADMDHECNGNQDSKSAAKKIWRHLIDAGVLALDDPHDAGKLKGETP